MNPLSSNFTSLLILCTFFVYLSDRITARKLQNLVEGSSDIITEIPDGPNPQELRQLKPRVYIQPQSSHGSQVIPIESTAKKINEQTMRKRIRQGRKRRRRPQLLEINEWYRSSHDPLNSTMEVFLSSDEEWEHVSNIHKPTHEVDRSNNWETPGQLSFHNRNGLTFESRLKDKPEETLTEVNLSKGIENNFHSTYEQFNVTVNSKENSQKTYRKPYSLKKEEQRIITPVPTFQLKSILKQSGGLSLSEVLQQKNVSLSDLLEGKQIALAALVQNPKKLAVDLSNKTNFENKNLSYIQTESPIQREQKEYRIRHFVRSKNKPTISDSSYTYINDDSRPSTKFDFHTRQTLQDETSSNNLIESIALDKDDDARVFPSVETKQMALNPVVPVHREKFERRPIKNVIPRIRPDFTNSKVVKSEDPLVNNKRRKFNLTESLFPSATSKEQERDKLLPKSNTRDRIPSKIPYRSVLEPPEKNLTSSDLVKVSPKDNIMTANTTPKNIDIIRNRLNIKPRIRLPSRNGVRIKITASTESPTTYAVINDEHMDETTKPLINNEELTTKKWEISNVNTNEKNIVETKLKGNLFPSRERMPVSRIQKIQHKSKYSTTTTENTTNITITKITTESPTTTKSLIIGTIKNQLDLESTELDLVAEKNEILQLLEDRRHGLKLNKVLEQSNMTIDDLMEHRKRGSSHVHLQELLKTKRKLAEKTKLEDRIDIVTAFENFPRFNIGNLKSIQPDDIKTDSQGFSYFTSIINIRPTDEIYKEARALQDIHKFAKESNRQYKTFNSFNENANTETRNPTFTGTIKLVEFKEKNSSETNSESETVRQNIIRETTSQISSGVKSAIIVSSCIVVVTIIFFSFLLAFYRWRQHHKGKLNYTESYKIAKKNCIIHKEPLKDKNISPVLCAKHRNISGRISQLTTMDSNSSEIHNYLGWDTIKNGLQLT